MQKTDITVKIGKGKDSEGNKIKREEKVTSVMLYTDKELETLVTQGLKKEHAAKLNEWVTRQARNIVKGGKRVEIREKIKTLAKTLREHPDQILRVEAALRGK